MSRVRERFETIVPKAQEKLDLIVAQSFCGIPATLPDIIQEKSFCGVGLTNVTRPIPAGTKNQFDQDFPEFPAGGFPAKPDPPDPTTPNKPTVPQDPKPPEDKPFIPPSPDPDPNDTCGLFTPNDSGCLKFDMDAIRTIQMKSTDILAHYVDLGGPTDPMVDSMTSQCGDRHPSGIASDDPCLFTLGVAKNFQIDMAVSSSGDCATRDAADQSSIQKYLDAGGSLVDTQINSVTVTTTTGDGNVNCIGDLKKVLDYGVEVTIPEGFYVSYDGALGFGGRPQYHRLSFGWIKAGSYFLDSPAFKTRGSTRVHEYLTNLKLGRAIEGFHGLGEFRYQDRHPNFYLLSGLKGINTYSMDGTTVYYSGSPLSDENPYDGYIVEGLGTASSPLKVNWVPFSHKKTLSPLILTNMYGNQLRSNRRHAENNLKLIEKYDSRNHHNTPHKFTISQKGTLIVRIDSLVGPNQTMTAFKSREGYVGTDSTFNYGVNVTSSATKQYFQAEYKSIPFDFSYTMDYAILGGRGRVAGGDAMIFDSNFCNPIAISGYEIYGSPTYYGF